MTRRSSRILIKPDKTADFEFVLNKLKEALNKSEKPERKQQAAGWKVFKSTQMAQGNAVYLMRIDPVVKGQEYDISRLIAEVFPVEVQEIFAKYKEAFAGRAITEMTALMSMSAVATDRAPERSPGHDCPCRRRCAATAPRAADSRSPVSSLRPSRNPPTNQSPGQSVRLRATIQPTPRIRRRSRFQPAYRPHRRAGARGKDG